MQLDFNSRHVLFRVGVGAATPYESVKVCEGYLNVVTKAHLHLHYHVVDVGIIENKLFLSANNISGTCTIRIMANHGKIASQTCRTTIHVIICMCSITYIKITL